MGNVRCRPVADIRKLGDGSLMSATQRACILTTVAAVLSLSDVQASAGTTARQNGQISMRCPTSLPLARLVAEADLIIVASPEVPAERLRSAMLEQAQEYIEVPLGGVTILKGEPESTSLTVRVYPRETSYAPSPEMLIRRHGQPTLFFLTRVDEGPIGLYLTHSVNAVQEASQAQREVVQAELHRQQEAAQGFTINASLPHLGRVRELLSGLPHVSAERQEQIFRDLEALGRDAVPAIVALMDDKRPLAHERMSLVNHAPDAFEAIRHYGPKLVVDALDAILNQLTGFGGSIVNGGSERERRSAINAWRVFAADEGCA